MPGRTPSRSAVAVQAPTIGCSPGIGPRAAGLPLSSGLAFSAAWRSKAGIETQATIGTYVLHEHTFPCQVALTGGDHDPMLGVVITVVLLFVAFIALTLWAQATIL
jgi:hypothetical protein